MKRMLLHNEIYNDLIQRIQVGEFKTGDTLPTELELQQMYGVSRSPVRQAMEELRHQGFIVRQPGRGTYVSAPADRATTAWRHLTGFAPHYVSEFSKVSARLLAVERVRPPVEAERHLQLRPGQKVLSLTRLRTAGAEPIAHLQHFLAPMVGNLEEVIREQPSFRSMTVLLEQEGYYLTEVQEQLWAVACPGGVAEQLGIAVGHPVLLIHRRAFDAGRRPMEFVRYHMRSEKWQYHTLFSR